MRRPKAKPQEPADVLKSAQQIYRAFKEESAVAQRYRDALLEIATTGDDRSAYLASVALRGDEPA